MPTPSYVEKISTVSGASPKTVSEFLDMCYAKELLFRPVDAGYLDRALQAGLQPIGPENKDSGSSQWARGLSLFLDPDHTPFVFQGQTYDLEGMGALFFDKAYIGEPEALTGRKRAALLVTDRQQLAKYGISVINEDTKNPDSEITIWGAVPKQAIDLIHLDVDTSAYNEDREAGQRLERELLEALHYVAHVPLEDQRGRIFRRTEIGLFSAERAALL